MSKALLPPPRRADSPLHPRFDFAPREGHGDPVKHHRGRTLAGYTLAVVLCLVILTWTMKLWRADLSQPPLYSGDSLFIQMWIQNMIEESWYVHSDRLALPGGLDMRDYPMSDNLHFALMKGIALVYPDSGTVYTLYFLLTFPLTTLTTLFVARHFQLRWGPALLVSLLFTFLPYHSLRIYHLFLAAYYLVPLLVLVVLRLMLDRPVLFTPRPGSARPVLNLRGRPALASVAICLLLSSAGLYYALFACYFLVAAGVVAHFHKARLAPLRSAMILSGFIFLGIVANVTPTLLYHAQHGPNPLAYVRTAAEAEIYGLKIVQMVLPIDNHRLHFLADLKSRYYLSFVPCNNENTTATLGLIGSIGFLALGGYLFCRRPGSPGIPLIGALSVLTGLGVLLGTIGGLGSVLAQLVSCQVRAYNRISVYLALFAFLAVGWALSRLEARWARGRYRRLCGYSLIAALLYLGVLDQTARQHAPDYAAVGRAYRGDAAYFHRVEAALPAGAMIWELPRVAFPEDGTRPPPWVCYDHFRGYLHTTTLRWSYGTMRGRPGDRWQQALARQPLAIQVRWLALTGFAGIHVDRLAYPDYGARLHARLCRLLGVQPLVSADRRLAFYPLGELTRQLKQQYSPTEWDRQRMRCIHCTDALCVK